MGARGTVGDKWSQRILWFSAIGTAISLYMVAVERQAQNRARAMSEGLMGETTSGEEV
ncbi:hrpN-interacting protein from malus protein [Wolffia australiana]